MENTRKNQLAINARTANKRFNFVELRFCKKELGKTSAEL